MNRLIYRPEYAMPEEDWVTIPAGNFQMGSENGVDNEAPMHTVYLDEYQIGKYEITNNQYNQCIQSGTCKGTVVTDKLDHPVVIVTWYSAKTYCKWVGGRLPTEAEWEKAASWNTETQTKFIYPWGNDDPSSDLLNYHNNVGDTTPVGTYPAGENGLFDMAGNVWEWTSSLYQPYPYDANDGREVVYSSFTRVLRGNSWDSDGGIFDYVLRSAYRNWNYDEYTSYEVGFRCSRSPEGQ